MNINLLNFSAYFSKLFYLFQSCFVVLEKINIPNKRPLLDDSFSDDEIIPPKRRRRIIVESDSEDEVLPLVGEQSPEIPNQSPNKDDIDDTERIDWNNIEYETAVGKRMDCENMIYTKTEKQLYGKNRTLKNGDVAFLCRLYSKHKCKSRLYMKNGRLFRKGDFIPHNHPVQEQDKINFGVECVIKKECANIDVVVNAKTQTSECHEVFHRNIKK